MGTGYFLHSDSYNLPIFESNGNENGDRPSGWSFYVAILYNDARIHPSVDWNSVE